MEKQVGGAQKEMNQQMGLVKRPMNPESKGYGNWVGEAQRDVAKAYRNVRMDWAKDAQRYKVGQGCLKE